MEIWKDISGYEGCYQVSNHGRVKSLARQCWNGKTYYGIPEKILKPYLRNDNRLQVSLWKDGKAKSSKISRLVALAFIPNPDNKPEVNHKNGNTLNNHDWNLDWMTTAENDEHARQNGLKNDKGIYNPSNKFTEMQIKEIRALKGKMPQKEIAIVYKMSTAQVSRIIKNRQWSHI